MKGVLGALTPWLFGYVVVFACAPLGAEIVLQTQAGAEPLRLVSAGGVAWVESRAVEGDAGSRQLLPERAGAEWRSFSTLSDGWVAAASFASDGGERLLVVRRSAAGVETLSSPASPESSVHSWPQLFVSDGRWVGLAWLEGASPRTLSVRAAGWNGEAWGPVETISPPGRGTQTALAASVLRDGRWLLVWSAYDGEDDEVVWSLGGGADWSVPAPIHPPNRVPDIVPAAVTTNDGSFVAWSQFDGSDYRLRVARWEASGWSVMPWRGGRGSLFPSFVEVAGTTVLLFENTVPRRWSVAEIAATRVVRTAHRERSADGSASVAGRPWIVRSGTGLALRWPDEADEWSLRWTEVD